MASFYEKPSHFVLEKTWDEKTRLPKTYKLQSSYSRNKIKAKVQQDSGNLGVVLLLTERSLSLKKGPRDYAHSFVEFKNVLQGQYKTAWKQVIHEHFPEPTNPENVPVEHDRLSKANFRHAVELFITKVLHEKKPWDRQYIYMMPGGNHNIQKKIKVSHQWKEMMCVMGLLPKGNILIPNKQLQVEWFYMTLHKSDHAEYVRSGRKLSNKMLQTIADYFQSIHETRENNGSLTRHQIKKIRVEAKCQLCREVEEQYAHKKRLLSDQRRGYRLYDQHNGGHNCCQHGQRKQRKLHNDGSLGDDKRDDRKSPPEREDKDFKPCRIHGKHAKHSYEECRANPHKQAKLRANNNQCRHESSHFNDNHYTSSDDELCGSAHTPMPSNGDVSASNESKAEENFYLSEGKRNKKRRLGNVPSSSHSRKSGSTSKKCSTSKKHQNSDINLEWDKTFEDAFITDFDIADFKNGIQVENLFMFGN
jgi:hypothetical protein